MKARIIETGEIVDIIRRSKFSENRRPEQQSWEVLYRDGNETLFVDYCKDYHAKYEELEKPIKEINWEQRKYELVKSAISGCADVSLREAYRELTVIAAFNLADDIIEELKKKQNDKQD